MHTRNTEANQALEPIANTPAQLCVRPRLEEYVMNKSKFIFVSSISLMFLIATVLYVIFSFQWREYSDDAWFLFLIGFILLAPCIFWLLPRFTRGIVKHGLTAVISWLCLGPIYFGPEGTWSPAGLVILYPIAFAPSSMGGIGIRSTLGSYLLLMAALFASFALEIKRSRTSA